MKRIFIIVLVLVFSTACFASEALDVDSVLAMVFPDAEDIKAKTYKLTDAQISKIKAKLKKKSVIPKDEDFEDIKSMKVYAGYEGGSATGYALIGWNKGRWGKDIKMMIVINSESGIIDNIAIMKCDERRGNITHMNFLSQFIDKGLEDPIEAHDDIMAVSGATISSGTACYIVTKLLLAYKETGLGKKK